MSPAPLLSTHSQMKPERPNSSWMLQITGVDGAEEQVPPQRIAALRRFKEILSELTSEDETGNEKSIEEESIEPNEETVKVVVCSLRFIRQEDTTKHQGFTIAKESSGTIAWPALSASSLEDLHRGSVLCIDEIDSSLHSHPVDILIGLFQGPETLPGAPN